MAIPKVKFPGAISGVFGAVEGFFKAKTPPLIGMDISTSAVKMVELSDSGNGMYRIERYAIEPLPKESVVEGNINNLDAVGEAIKRCHNRLGSSIKNVAIALPNAAVITKKILVPAGLTDDEIEVQVETEANQYIPFSLDEVNLDFQVIGPAPGSEDDVEVLIAASRKEKVEDRVAATELAGLKPVVVDVDLLAAQAAYELIESQFPDKGLDQNIAIVDVGASFTMVNVLRNGQSIYLCEQPFGGSQLTQEIQDKFGLSREEAEVAKRAGGLPDNYETDVLNPFLETFGLEVARALQFFFTSTQFNQVNHIVLSGGYAALPGVDAVVAQRTQVNTLIANPFANMALSSKVRPKNLQQDAPSMMVACGLALRRFDA